MMPRHLQRAFSLALLHPEFKNMQSSHGAVITKGGNIVSTGINKVKKNQFVRHFEHHAGCHTHAEMDAVLKSRRKVDLNGAVMYVARVRKMDMAPGESRPCPACMKVLKRYGIKKVVYTTNTHFLVERI